MSLAENPRAVVGANEPPADADPILDRLHSDHAELVKRRDALLASIARAPDTIESEDIAKKMADFVQLQINGFIKEAGAVHQAEKEPYLTAGRTVDSFWHSLIDEIKTGKTALNAARKKYGDAKAAEERRVREEAARQARAEQERLAREAAEAAAKLREESDLQAAIDAEERAKVAQAEAEKRAKELAAKPAELGRTRGDYGGMTTLKAFWNHADIDRATLDLEALRSHLPAKAIDQAIKSWIAANKAELEAGKRLAGVRIFEDTRI